MLFPFSLKLSSEISKSLCVALGPPCCSSLQWPQGWEEIWPSRHPPRCCCSALPAQFLAVQGHSYLSHKVSAWSCCPVPICCPWNVSVPTQWKPDGDKAHIGLSKVSKHLCWLGPKGKPWNSGLLAQKLLSKILRTSKGDFSSPSQGRSLVCSEKPEHNTSLGSPDSLCDMAQME